MICECKDFDQNVEMINNCVRYAEIHAMPLAPTYKEFLYCPWCGGMLRHKWELHLHLQSLTKSVPKESDMKIEPRAIDVE